jgi:hypothetical protein
MWSKAKQARMDEIHDELGRMLQTKNFSPGEMDALVAEGERLVIERDNYEKAKGMGSYASPSEYGVTGNPGEYDGGGGFGPGVRWKSFGLPNPDTAPQVDAPTMDISREQIKSLFDAAKAGVPYKVELGQKDFASTMRQKTPGAPLTESGLNNQLPAIQVPGQYGQYGKPYEPFRLLANIPTVAMTGPSAAYLSWTGNTNNATRVPEGGEKPSLGPVITENFIKPMKLAATIEGSMEILQDHEEFAQWLPTGLQQNLVNAESEYLIQGQRFRRPDSFGVQRPAGYERNVYAGRDRAQLRRRPVNGVRADPHRRSL